MNREAIKATAVCRYETKEKAYIVESPLLDICHGIADTSDEAWDIFHDLLDEMYIEYLEGKGVGNYKRGRPGKGRVEFHAQLKADSKSDIAILAKELGVSQGEAVDYLLFHYQCNRASSKADNDRKLKRKAG